MKLVRSGIFLILVFGWLNHSAAVERGLPPLRSYFAADQSAGSDSAQPRGKRIYLAPGPLDGGKVIVEYLSGGLFSTLSGLLFAAAGSGITRNNNGSDDWNLSGLEGAAYGYLVGSNVGSTFGVCIVGNSGNEHGSAWGAFAGSAIGTVAGLGLASIIAQRNLDNFGWTFATYTLTQTTGTVLGFNLTRKRVAYAEPPPR